MSEVKFISDTHFGHKSITKFRQQFATVEEHDEFVLQSILDSVTTRDTLWILGDVCFTMEAFNKCVVPIAERVQRLHIIIGNHDFERKHSPTISEYLNIGAKLHSMSIYKGYTLSHAPIHPESLRGTKNMHGHVHETTINDSRYVNVCCENLDFTPMTLAAIELWDDSRVFGLKE